MSFYRFMDLPSTMSRIKLAGVTPVQADLLKRFYFFYSNQPRTHERGLRPCDIGTVQSSAQYDGLRRLVEQGLVERAVEQGGTRHVYRLTSTGADKWKLLQLLSQTPRQAVLGPEEGSRKLRAFATLCAA